MLDLAVAPLVSAAGRIKFNVKEEEFKFEVMGEMEEEARAKRKDSEKKEEEVWGVDFEADKGGGGDVMLRGGRKKVVAERVVDEGEAAFNADGEVQVDDVLVNEIKVVKGRGKKKKKKIIR